MKVNCVWNAAKVIFYCTWQDCIWKYIFCLLMASLNDNYTDIVHCVRNSHTSNTYKCYISIGKQCCNSSTSHYNRFLLRNFALLPKSSCKLWSSMDCWHCWWMTGHATLLSTLPHGSFISPWFCNVRLKEEAKFWFNYRSLTIETITRYRTFIFYYHNFSRPFYWLAPRCTWTW